MNSYLNNKTNQYFSDFDVSPDPMEDLEVLAKLNPKEFFRWCETMENMETEFLA